MQKLSGYLLALAAIGVLTLRLVDLNLASFILDEPQFLDAARAQLTTGQWHSASPLVGTLGLHYGPTALWFYGLVQSVFGYTARTNITAMCLMLTVAHLALASGLAWLFRGGPMLFGAVLLCIASSPYQFFWSRLAWDQMTNVGASWSLFVFCLPGRLTWLSAAPLGLILGLSISSHLMILPFVAAVFAVFIVELRRKPIRLVGATGVMIAGIVLVNIPYLSYLAHTGIRVNPSPGFSKAILAEYLLQPVRVSTTWGIEYFFDQDWRDFWDWLGNVRAFYSPSWLSLAFAAHLTALGVTVSLRHPKTRVRRVALLAVLVWLGALVPAVRSIDPHPHYQFATWWIVPFGAAAALSWASQRRSTILSAVAIGGGLLIVSNVLFDIEWMRFVRERGGTRGIHYSTPVGLQEKAIRAICASPSTVIQVQNETVLWPFPISYGISTEPSCLGKRISICRPDECLSVGPGMVRIRLTYAKERGGELRVQ
jgi:hypothetical protein